MSTVSLEYSFVSDACKPLQHSERACVDPMNTIQQDQLSLQSSIHKGRGPPGSVSIGKSVSLL